MKRVSHLLVVCSLGAILFEACDSSQRITHTNANSFIEGAISVVPPVKLKTSREGVETFVSYNDGGTMMITIIDSVGKSIDVYCDHRIGKTPGTIYLNAYPDDPGSIRVKDQAGFKKKILEPLRQSSQAIRDMVEGP
ncbi:MAG: hypothetical protein HZA88_04180 [Verrucomicrobia bacterium]|nr:hypothetical protein [Verrucomicrobiota bacterium]